MIHSTIWMFFLTIAVIQFDVCESSTHEDMKVDLASTFFDADLCDDEDALNWVCFIPRGCANEQPPLELRETITGHYEATHCDAVLAIQQHSKYSTVEGYHNDSDPYSFVWRVVMQVQNVNEHLRNVSSNVDMDAPHVKFIHGMKPLVECSATGSSVIVQKLKYTNSIKIFHAKGVYDKDHNMFMCEFKIDFGRSKIASHNIHTGKTGIEWRKKSNSMETVKSLGKSLAMAAAAEAKVMCDIESFKRLDYGDNENWMQQSKQILERDYFSPARVDIEEVVRDRVKVTCRPDTNAKMIEKFEYERYADYVVCVNGEWIRVPPHYTYPGSTHLKTTLYCAIITYP